MKLLDRLAFAVRNPWAAIDRVMQRQYAAVEIAPGVTRKAYGTYTDYLRHQRRKVRWRSKAWLAEYDAKYRAVLGERVKASGLIRPGARVLCLAARRGGEVRAFRDIGSFAVGIDLEPGRTNDAVLYGDFHALGFPDHCVDLVFTNSLDHVFDLKRLLGEVHRVLVPGGFFVSETVIGRADGLAHSYYDAAGWRTVDNIVSIVESSRFTTRERRAVDFPGGREWIVFQQRAALDSREPAHGEASARPLDMVR
jgi:SAM-dependent methyltransferase